VDLYAVLGVERGASADEIRRAFRQAALLWHPDRNPDADAAEVFRAVQQAYERLRDPQRRSAYDRTLEAPFGPGTARLADGPPPQWVPPREEREPLRFVAGRGWTTWEDEGERPHTEPTPTHARPSEGRTRWSRDERLGIAVATFAAVAGAVAIAIAPMIS
jgi:curved DNA-binding protein CbpA